MVQILAVRDRIAKLYFFFHNLLDWLLLVATYYYRVQMMDDCNL